MPWSNGTFSRNNGKFTGSDVWQNDAIDAEIDGKIVSTRHDTHDQDLASGINSCLHKGGQNTVTGDIDWGSFKITNLGTPVNAGDAVPKSFLTFLNLGDTPSTYTADRYLKSGASSLSWQQLATVAETGAYSDLTGKPTLATVAGTGLYSDLIGAPSVPSAIGDLSNVVTAGITDGQILKWVDANSRFEPAADSGTGGGASSFNELSDVTDYVVSDGLKVIRVNAAGDGLEAGVALSTVASTGAYSDLSGKPSLAAVATSGNYNDLSNKPTLKSNLDSLDDVNVSGATNGQLLSFNGSNWVPISSSLNTNLGIGTRTATQVEITSSNGSNTNFPAATTSLAGAMSATDKAKLDGVAENATKNSHTVSTSGPSGVADDGHVWYQVY